MGSMLRGEKMALAQLFIQPETAYNSISELGESGLVQFKELNEDVSAVQKKFINEVRRCEEMERKLRYFRCEIMKEDIPIPECLELPKAPNPKEMINLEANMEKTDDDMMELSESAVNLKSNYLELIELEHVLQKTSVMFNTDQEDFISIIQNTAAEQSRRSSISGHLSYIAGVINDERVPAFELMLWRISRGNVFLRQMQIEDILEDPATGNDLKKTVFVVFFQGQQLKSRIKKVCEGFRATLYACPDTEAERTELKTNVHVRLEDLKMILNQTEDHRQTLLVSVSKKLHNWDVMVLKMKAIYHILNMFSVDVTKKCLIGECWLPVNNYEKVRKLLADVSTMSGSSIPSFMDIIDTTEVPPTYIKTNKFTKGFQNLIDAYGVACYGELNPGLYTLVTFPFLFAVMFGDFGHGIIILLFGAYLVIYENKIEAKKIKDEIFNIFFSGRYIILLMGMFSIYTGLIYNDVFSRPLNIFGSGWKIVYDEDTVLSKPSFELDPKDSHTGNPYIFGLDPAWHLAENKINFLNSYKMKLSIIFGVVHMMFGLCLNAVNHIHFRRYSSIFLEFIPQLMFLIFLFLWLVILMVMKWIMYGAQNEGEYGTACAPSVLILFINMVLFKSAEPPEGCEEFMFKGQKTVQMVLLVLAVICVPIMLFGKPLYIHFTKKTPKPSEIELQPVNGIQHESSPEVEHEEPMSEILIHQSIETIEYVLSTISHTASYLRLWALSLAHSQLSEILWMKIFRLALKMDLGGYPGSALIFLIFPCWAFPTLGILVVIEGLSAFLHTLRLHWVEFMSKFYKGTGYPFQPFNFKMILETQEEDVQ